MKRRRNIITGLVGGIVAGSIAAALSIGSGTIATSNFNGTGTIPQIVGPLFHGVQCANTGTVSKPPRYRGTIAIVHTNTGEGSGAAAITLPTTPQGLGYTLTACNMNTALAPIGLGTTSYQGVMFYIPAGWTIPNGFPYGVNIYELHFQNIWAAPVILQLHPNSVALALETGACYSFNTTHPGCQYRSNIGTCNKGAWTCLPPEYAIPPGALKPGQWEEVIVQTDWESTATGSVQTYYKVKGSPTWTPGAGVSGIPTVQWVITNGCCRPSYVDELEAYTGALKAPLTVTFDNAVDGSSLAAVEAAMP